MDDLERIRSAVVSFWIRHAAVRYVATDRSPRSTLARYRGIPHETAGHRPAVSWLPETEVDHTPVESAYEFAPQ